MDTVFLASTRNGNFSKGKIGFFLEIDFYMNKTLHQHWRIS